MDTEIRIFNKFYDAVYMVYGCIIGDGFNKNINYNTLKANAVR